MLWGVGPKRCFCWFAAMWRCSSIVQRAPVNDKSGVSLWEKTFLPAIILSGFICIFWLVCTLTVAHPQLLTSKLANRYIWMFLIAAVSGKWVLELEVAKAHCQHAQTCLSSQHFGLMQAGIKCLLYITELGMLTSINVCSCSDPITFIFHLPLPEIVLGVSF